jgi:hypothetical protein
MKYISYIVVIVGILGLALSYRSRNIVYSGTLEDVNKTTDSTTFVFTDGKIITLPINNNIEYAKGSRLSLVDWGFGSQQMILDME